MAKPFHFLKQKLNSMNYLLIAISLLAAAGFVLPKINKNIKIPYRKTGLYLLALTTVSLGIAYLAYQQKYTFGIEYLVFFAFAIVGIVHAFLWFIIPTWTKQLSELPQLFCSVLISLFLVVVVWLSAFLTETDDTTYYLAAPLFFLIPICIRLMFWTEAQRPEPEYSSVKIVKGRKVELETGKTILLHFIIHQQKEKQKTLQLTVDAPLNMSLKTFYQNVVFRYNERCGNNQIEDSEEHQGISWVFIHKNWFWKNYLDSEAPIGQLRLKSHDKVYAIRIHSLNLINHESEYHSQLGERAESNRPHYEPIHQLDYQLPVPNPRVTTKHL